MNRHRDIVYYAHVLFACLFMHTATAGGAIMQTGNVEPDVNLWNFFTEAKIGLTSDGSVQVDLGSILNSLIGYLGSENGSSGSAIVAGAGSQWKNGKELYIRNGSLFIEAGGQVSSHLAVLSNSSGSTSTVVVTDLGSNLTTIGNLDVGRLGNGSLTVEAGAKVSSSKSHIGYGTGSTGTVTVTGIGSNWTISNTLSLGDFGTGTLTVDNGGEVIAGELYASLSDLRGDGTITATQGAALDADLLFDAAHGNQAVLNFGSGGILNVIAAGGSLGVGLKQSGSLVVAEGVQVSSNVGALGQRLGSAGTATVTGTDSKWLNSTTLYVGVDGTGSLTAAAGGHVSNWFGYLGYNSTSKGVAKIAGANSKWTNGRDLYVGRHGEGELTITSGGLVRVDRTLVIDFDMDGDSFINMATGGMLALRGDADSSLGEFLNLIVGTDAIHFWDSALLDWTPLTEATYGAEYTLSYITDGDLMGYTLLTVGRVGDFDNDGDVDGRDFLAWQRNPDLGELANWQAAYGPNSSLAANSAAVPEPSTHLLTLLAASFALAVARNRR